MDTKELLKKYWFIGVIGLALLVFVGVYAADSYKNRAITVDGKQVDGKDVVYTLDGEDVLADDFYNTLYSAYGVNTGFLSYERALLNNAYETTQELQNNAANYATNIMQRYSVSDIEKSLKPAGYINGVDDLQEYLINLQKRDIAVKEFVTANQDKYLSDQLGTNGRLIYHILVKTETEEVTDEEGNVIEYKALPTDEQKEKLSTIQEALKDENNTFQYVAYQYSEDGSNASGGYIGMINEENSTNYDQFFAKAALELEDGKTSEVITSRYGYHIIYNAGSSLDAILNDDYFLSDLESANPSLVIEAILSKGEEKGFEIVDEDLKAQIKAQMGSDGE